MSRRRLAVVASLLAITVLLGGCGGKSATDKASQNLLVSLSQLAIATDVSHDLSGTYSVSVDGNPLAATNGLLDEINGTSSSNRKKQIDEALAAFGKDPGLCDACVSALEQARP